MVVEKGTNTNSRKRVLIFLVVIALAGNVTSCATLEKKDTVSVLDQNATDTALSGTSFKVLSFTMTPERVIPGEQVTLRWETNAEKVFLDRSTSILLQPALEFYGPVGTTTITEASTYRSFTLYATGAEYSRSYRTHFPSATIYVKCRPEAWFFSNPPEICPHKPPSVSTWTTQAFENGILIVVRGGQDIYYALLDTGDLLSVVFGAGGDWDHNWDTLTQQYPEFVNALGQPLGTPADYQGSGQADPSRRHTSYISGPNGEVYEVHLFSSSGPIGKGNWRLVQGAVSNE
jgi:hypothetical protein